VWRAYPSAPYHCCKARAANGAAVLTSVTIDQPPGYADPLRSPSLAGGQPGRKHS
jgi:hypothetical protein